VKDRREYQKAIEIIGGVIRTWDPYCLIGEGAPIDEFDAEIAKIAVRIPEFRAAGDVAKAISEIFSRSFAPDTFSVGDCTGPAEEIFTGLGRAKLLPAA
jgi:hypothetical protein